MYVNEDLTTVYRNPADYTIVIEYKGKVFRIPQEDSNWEMANELYKKCASTPKINRMFTSYTIPTFISGTDTPIVSTAIDELTTKKDILEQGLSALIDFFSEFQFTPSFRFTNTLGFKAIKSIASAQTYVHHYFELMGSNFADDVAQKIKSKEFATLLAQIAQYGTPAIPVNTRFKVYFGAAGTGKTTLAQTETDNRCIVCNSSMLPSDLMENFIFKDGKPDFNPSILWECMEQGKPIVLDEINLLPFDSLRFLQGIADGKTSFIYKNREVHIANGFKIIGTMNLTLGGVTYGLPEPLVDRCEDIREFNLSAKQLMGAITGSFVAG